MGITKLPQYDYDIIIIGGGPAGITAGIYATRKKIKTLLVAKDLWGQIGKTERVDNWPGDPGISGMDLMKKLENHLKVFLSEMVIGGAVESAQKSPNGFLVRIQGGQEFSSRALIVAVGRKEKDLGVPGEKELLGKGVSYCSICEAPFFQDKKVGVIGGGNAALGSALDAAKYANEVILLVNSENLQADEILQEVVNGNPKIKILFNKKVKEILGGERVEGVVCEDAHGSETSRLSLDGIFVSIGSEPVLDFMSDLIEKNERGEIKVVPRTCASSCPGLYAAGDVNDGQWKQFVIAAGDGARATLAVYEYLRDIKRV